MSVFTRTAPAPQRRDLTSAPWVDGRTVPTPLQDADGGIAPYRPGEALQVAAVVACVGLRAGALAQVPLKEYEEAADGHGVLVSPQPELLRRPSEVWVPSLWKSQMSISRDTFGWALGRITAVDGGGYASKVEWLPPNACHPTRRYVGAPIDWRVGGQPMDSSVLLHVPSRWVTPERPEGVSPLEWSGLVDLAKRAQAFGVDWFKRGAVPTAIVYSEDEVNGEQADDILSKLVSRWRRRQPGFLGAGLKYEKVAVAANESQFLETCRQAAHDIAISFNMPPEKIGAAISGTSITYANRDQNRLEYQIDSINPDLVVIQEVIGQLRPDNRYLRWSTGAFLQSDLETRLKSYKLGVDAGIYVPDEPRAKEDMPPLPNGLGALPRPAGQTFNIAAS